jgi:hypothetical protein
MPPEREEPHRESRMERAARDLDQVIFLTLKLNQDTNSVTFPEGKSLYCWRYTFMNTRLSTPFLALRFGLGLTATLAGLDKFFNILADWGSYVSPVAVRALPFSVGTLMGIVGVIEIAVGLSILAISPRVGAYVASGWLLLVAANLVLAGHFDVAVRDIVMSIAAFTLARALEVQATAPARSGTATQPHAVTA